MSNYIKLNIYDKLCYVKKDSLEALKNVGGVIFDCDGVLIDTRRSYDEAVVQTVEYIISRLYPKSFNSTIVTPIIIDKIRESGGFNNDQNACYAILLYIFSNLPRDFRAPLRSFVYQGQDPFSNFNRAVELLAKARSDNKQPFDVSRLQEGLLEFASKLDVSGIKMVESKIIEENSEHDHIKEELSGFKAILRYPGKVGESLLATVFDEIFYGPKLFSELHHIDPRLGLNKGLIEDEEIIVSRETMQKLQKRFGTRNLAIVTGRSLLATRFGLEKLLDFFNLYSSVFIEDEERVSLKDAVIGKPNPYSLLKAVEAFDDVGRILYVGDSVEDLIMARNANLREDRFLFTGVFGYVNSPLNRLDVFRNIEADLIVKSVNDLPKVIEMLRGIGR